MDKRLLQRVRGLLAIKPQSSSGTTKITGAVIDRLGANGAMARSAILEIVNAAASPGTVVFTMTGVHGETSSPSDAMTFTSTPVTIDCAADGITSYQIDLEGFGRYVQFAVTPAITASGVAAVAGTITLGDMDINPEATPAVVLKKST